ncbi:LuxR C-terminal-related transcriptional regulator [Kordiimonas pumila]|uniref:LuxR C-terminal-related transcriptional regulator n=2 Tax=Kordiimonas pumila TaxID=2161677 RepID=A0ABV7D4N1_9PROT
MIPWLVTAKTVPPKRHTVLAQRLAILDQLSSYQDRAFTILEAPGGFGKSTVLSLWRNSLIEKSTHVAWLTLETEDTGSTLTTYLAYAFHLAGIDMKSTGLLEDRGATSDDCLHNLSIIISALQKSGKKVILMLDDIERLIEEDAVQVLNTLVRHAPESLHIAMAFRRNPGILLSNFLLDGAAIRLTAEDLRFSYEEVDELFGHSLSKADMQTVLDRTEGWPVALRLIKGENGNTSNYIDKIRHFSGERGLASEYFSEQVFSRLTETEQAFLLDVSVLEWLEVPLIDAIRGTSDSALILDGLSHLEGVIVPLDAQEETYRLHALFREFLANTNQRENIKRFLELQRKAAKALASRSRLLTALRHTKQAGDNTLFGEILEQAGGIMIWLREGMTRIVHADKLMDDQVVQDFPRLGFLRCIVQMKAGHLKDAQTLFNQLGEQTAGFSKDRKGGDDATLYQDHIFVRTMLAAYGCMPLSDELLSRILPREKEGIQDDAIIMGHYKTLLCLANQQKAEFSQAWQFGKEAIDHFHQAPSLYGKLFMDFHFGSITMVQGEALDAENHYAKAQKEARRHFPRDQGLQLVGDILTAELDLERNLVKRFKRKLNNIIQRLHDSEAWFDIYSAAYSVVADVTLEEEGANDAQAFLLEATERAEEQGLAKLSSYLTAIRTSVMLYEKNTEQAKRLYEKAALPTDISELFDMERYTWREVETYVCTLIQLRTVSGDYDEGRAIIKSCLQFSEHKNLTRLTVRCLVHASALEKAAQNNEAALQHLRDALERIKYNGYIRPFFRCADQIGSLLSVLVEEGDDSDVNTQAKKVKAHLKLSSQLNENGQFFSLREIEILRGLDRGFQDKVIARNLSVTPHAVRYHLKNIYAKTDATNRIQALNKAKKMGAFTGLS